MMVVIDPSATVMQSETFRQIRFPIFWVKDDTAKTNKHVQVEMMQKLVQKHFDLTLQTNSYFSVIQVYNLSNF